MKFEISTALNKEVAHYRAVAKKYKRAKKVFNYIPPAAQAFFQPLFQAPVLVLLFLLSVYRLQYPLASLVGVLLSLLQV